MADSERLRVKIDDVLGNGKADVETLSKKPAGSLFWRRTEIKTRGT